MKTAIFHNMLMRKRVKKERENSVKYKHRYQEERKQHSLTNRIFNISRFNTKRYKQINKAEKRPI
jgi:hypothetical protein